MDLQDESGLGLLDSSSLVLEDSVALAFGLPFITKAALQDIQDVLSSYPLTISKAYSSLVFPVIIRYPAFPAISLRRSTSRGAIIHA